MRWLFRLAFRGQRAHVSHMREEIAWLRTQLLYERGRADRAISHLLAVRTGIGGGIVPPEADPQRDDVNAMFRDPEIAAMGLSEGVN